MHICISIVYYFHFLFIWIGERKMLSTSVRKLQEVPFINLYFLISLGSFGRCGWQLEGLLQGYVQEGNQQHSEFDSCFDFAHHSLFTCWILCVNRSPRKILKSLRPTTGVLSPRRKTWLSSTPSLRVKWAGKMIIHLVFIHSFIRYFQFCELGVYLNTFLTGFSAQCFAQTPSLTHTVSKILLTRPLQRVSLSLLQ